MRAASNSADHWSRNAVVYQIYPRSFADASGDGIGDLQGITSRLGKLAGLGVDAIWLSPFYRSPQNDGGYDVSDFCDVDPLFGDLADFAELVRTAHQLDLRVIVDIVPNHTSSEHPWFQEALESPVGSAARARYFFSDGLGPAGDLPPNNWQSAFGGSAWTRTTNPDGSVGQWYLHLFDTTQPDLDWSNPWVADQFDEILSWWVDAGVDGFRVDVATGLIKAAGLPNFEPGEHGIFGVSPFRGQPGVHEVFRRWRRLLDSKPGSPMMCGEVWIEPSELLTDWVRPDEMHQVFNFAFLTAEWNALKLRDVIETTLQQTEAVGATATWVLSNHDFVRHGSRLASPPVRPAMLGRAPDDPVAEAEDIAAVGRSATLMMLALPGSAYLYQGEELGLPEAIDLPNESRADPTWARSGGELVGRDGARVPLPWTSEGRSFGFSSSDSSWLPQPDDWGARSWEAQEGDASSTLEMYRLALQARKDHQLGSGALVRLEATEQLLSIQNGGLLCVTNFGDEPVALPPGRVLLRSASDGDALAANETAWIVAASS